MGHYMAVTASSVLSLVSDRPVMLLFILVSTAHGVELVIITLLPFLDISPNGPQL